MPESRDSRPTVDIDHQQPEWHDNRAEQWAEIRERCPVVFNQHYGGFWMATDYQSVSTAVRDAGGDGQQDAPEGTSGLQVQWCGLGALGSLGQRTASGEMPPARDTATPFPAVITLRRMGLPVASWETW